MRLTIAIPTYNRNDILLKNIKLLLPQLNNQCKLIIIDNCSDFPVKETLKDILSDFKNIEIKRNSINIGGNANIMRCFEYCETPYLWILGDDDPVKEDAIRIIFNNLEKRPDCTFFNFNTLIENDIIRDKTYFTKGVYEFVKGIDSFGRLLLISSNIYKVTEELKKSVIAGNLYQYSSAAHIVTLLLSLGNNSICCFSQEEIVRHGYNATPMELQGSPVVMALGLPIIFDLPLDFKIREELRNKILSWMKPRTVVRQLLLMSKFEDKKDEARYLYFIIRRRLFSLNRSLTIKMQLLLFDLFIIFPEWGFRAFAFFYKRTKGRSLDKNVLAGRTF